MKRYIFLLSFLFACQSNELQKSGQTRQGRPDAESWDAVITLTNKGAKRGVIRSGHLEKYNENEFILLDQNIDADFFNKEEVFTTNLKSLVAEIDEEEDFLVAIGNVVGSNIFNILGVLGLSALINGQIIFSKSFSGIDTIILILSSVWVYILLRNGSTNPRLYGSISLIAYLGYMILLYS